MQWNTELYDQKHAFVFQYGEDLLNLLDAKSGEQILDLGCGTGHLTQLIRNAGAQVIGVDSSVEMIEAARENFPEVHFEVQDAERLSFRNQFDAVFSNAVLHWVRDQQVMLHTVHKSLKSGGRFVVEMGGKNNVVQLVSALKTVLWKQGYEKQAETKVWFFPGLGEYTYLLENNGFKVVYAIYYERPTLLQNQERGVFDWIKQFGTPYLEGIDEEHRPAILQKVTRMVEPAYCRNGEWYADYKRLRFVAIKE